ncbi:hypothetical protein [Profundibacter sp.]
MNPIVDEIANKLAQDALKAADDHGNDQIVEDVGEILGATSSTTQESYRTFIRVHRASKRARQYLAKLDKT